MGTLLHAVVRFVELALLTLGGATLVALVQASPLMREYRVILLDAQAIWIGLSLVVALNVVIRTMTARRERRQREAATARAKVTRADMESLLNDYLGRGR